MKTCEDCGKKFNWLQRAVGEYKEHLKHCEQRLARKHKGNIPQGTGCRGCPAGCYENIDVNGEGNK
jgi:hypothetical protein